MCAPNSEGKPALCLTDSCISGTLKFCRRFTVDQPLYGNPGEFNGTFKCLDCYEMYEPSSEPIYLSYRSTGTGRDPLNVCQRRVGIFECGQFCQVELTGCARYQISRLRGGQATNIDETAIFRCLEALPGYSINEEIVEGITYNNQPKQVTFAAYTSGLIDCNTRMCQAVLPNCEQYYTVASSGSYTNIFCSRCKSTMIPLGYRQNSMPLIWMFFEGRRAITCDIKPLNSVPCDSVCKQEVPGCDSLSTMVFPNYYGVSDAIYKCDRCAAGLMQVTNDTRVTSWRNAPASQNIKIRCAPPEVRQSTSVSGDMAKILPRCQRYTAVYAPGSMYNVTQYSCQECEQGWEPTSEPASVEWFSRAERIVCKHVPFPGPVECNDECKQIFPSCDRAMVSKDVNGHNVYECVACQNGFYPISYSYGTSARLKYEQHEMRDQSRIYLCSNQPRERYWRLYFCDWRNEFAREDLGCTVDDNCRVLANVKQEFQLTGYFKCLECNSGYRPKSIVPSIYGGDITQCEKIPQQSKLAAASS